LLVWTLDISAMKAALFALAIVGVQADASNPLAKVIELMDDCAAKVKADGEAEAKAYKEYFEWCDDVAKNTNFEIKTAAAKKEKLESAIAKGTSDIEVATSKIEDLAASIAEDDAELKSATGVREKEAADFAKAEAELVEQLTLLIGLLAFWHVRWLKILLPLLRLTRAMSKKCCLASAQ